MKEHIDTIPVNDAFAAGDECPFCYLHRKAEQSTIRFVAGPGASYMEPDVRGATDKHGFCPEHTKKLYDYGNSLGAALILQTYYAGILERFQAETFTPGKKSLFGKKQPPVSDYPSQITAQADSCFICDRIDYHMHRYYLTFFHMIKDGQFRKTVENSKGFCLKHFAQLMENAQSMLSNQQQDWFYQTVPGLTEQNLLRVKEDLDWFIAKFDYRNAGADWKNSKDALSRTMQKLESIYPADPPYKKD